MTQIDFTREREIPAGDWTIRATVVEDRDSADRGRWDVRAEHKGGTRVPMGPNCHVDPTAEMERLEKLIDWPKPLLGS